MQHITATCNDVVRKSPTPFKKNKSKDQNCSDSPKTDEDKNGKNDSAHIAVGEITLKKIVLSSREKSNWLTQLQEKRVSIYGSVRFRATREFSDTIAFVDTADTKKIVTNNTVLKISKIGTTTCNLLALLDTGSPTSFISRQTFYNFFELAESSTIPSCSYNALNGTPKQIKNSVTTSIELELLPKIVSNVTFHILENNLLSYNLILG